MSRQAGQERGHPGDVAVVLAGLVGRAEDDLVDVVGSTPGPCHGLAHHQRGEVVGPGTGQGAAVPPDRGARSGDDEGLHVVTP